MNAVYTIAIDAPGRNDFARQAALMAKSLRVFGQFDGDIIVLSNSPKVPCTSPYTHVHVELPEGEDQRKWSTTFRFNIMETHEDLLMKYDRLLFIDTDVIIQRPLNWFSEKHYPQDLLYTSAPNRNAYRQSWYGANFDEEQKSTASTMMGITAGHVVTSKRMRKQIYAAWRDAHQNAIRRKGFVHTDQSAFNRLVHDIEFGGEYSVNATKMLLPIWDVVYYRTHRKRTTINQMHDALIVHYNGYKWQEERLKLMEGRYLQMDWAKRLTI